MNKLHLFLLSALSVFACTELQAQVTVGGLTASATGAILDLNSAAKGGLVLSNVALTNVSVIPESFPGVTSENYNTPEVKNSFKGAMVYHTGGNDIATGVYVWNGGRWRPVGGDPILFDAQGNDYTVAEFGAAGWWMTQNLRTTDYTYDSNRDPVQLVKKSTAAGSTTEPRYTYPCVNGEWSSISEADRDSIFRAHEHYGLLYNWAAASGRIDNPNTNEINNATQTEYRGVCPDGWHLPSDYEWVQLTNEIVANPDQYSYPIAWGDAWTGATPVWLGPTTAGWLCSVSGVRKIEIRLHGTR
jgi:uncharacterized protein (TIGR02145 family)